MKAITFDRYGPLDVLHLSDVAAPSPKPDQVIVRVKAAGLHIGDCFGVHGSPFMMRMVSGLTKPKRGIPGYDCAGIVEAVGQDVSHFHPGDEVFGYAEGTCAELVAVSEGKLASKPEGLSFEESAVLVTSGLAALHALRDVGKLRDGQSVLINGATGGVGSFAVQIAKALGAEVTAVCSTNNIEFAQLLGADHVIDYTREDFTRGSKRYDLILDNVENHSLADVRRALAPEGTLILNSGTGASGLAMIARLVAPLVLSPFSKQNLKRYLSMSNTKDLEVLSGLVAAGKLKPVIDRTYRLEEVPAALAYIETGHARGKVAVTVDGTAEASA